MQIADVPTRFPVPFANAAVAPYIRAIPEASQIGIEDGAASLTTGFPPLTFSPIAAGGVPPFGQDFNGLLNQITLWLRWQNAGAPVGYDAAFSTSIGGYPAGAILATAVGLGSFWVSLVDNNTTNPDTGGANWLRFCPGKLSTRQIFSTPGAGTYTTPTGIVPVRLSIRMVAGGGSGASRTIAGNNGTASIFSTITCNPGLGGGSGSGSTGGLGGAGGSGGAGASPTPLRIAGGDGPDGGGAATSGIGAILSATPCGAASVFGNGGPGAGGKPGAGVLSGADHGPGGGGAGEYAEFRIPGPLATTYAFTVGAGGVLVGDAKAGKAGIIIVDESYS